MRRSLLAIIALAAGTTISPAALAAGQHKVYAVPKHAPVPAMGGRRTRVSPAATNLASPRPPSNFSTYDTILRHPIYGGGRVHPGFYGGFERYGRVLPRSGDTNVDVDVRTPGLQAPPVVVTRPSGPVGTSGRRFSGSDWTLRPSSAPDLRALGDAASGNGPGSRELRELIGTIVARRDRQWQERLSGARVVAVDEYQREIDRERRAVRRLERRGRNPHILYLGFDD